MAEEVEIVDPELPLTVYDPLFQDIPIEEDAWEKSSKEEAQLEEEAPTEKEVELRNVLHNVIAKLMNAAFKEVVLENVAMKDQITNYTQMQGLEATVSTLNSMIPQLSSALTSLTSLMIAYSNQSHHIAEQHNMQFAAQMEYTHAVFVLRVT